MKAKKHHPPALATRFLLWFLRSDIAEEVQGDLDERFYSLLKEKSPFRAKANYWYEVIQYLRPFAIRKSNPFYTNQFAMLENYFKIGWRNMSKQKIYSSIKVGGFALGIAACLLISLFIRNEISYDQFYPDGERIYRVVEHYNDNGTLYRGIHFPAPTASALKENFPEVEEVARLNPVELFGAGSNDIRREDQLENTHEDGFTYADPQFLQMLDLPFVYGSPEHALKEPKTIVLTRRKAEKYFPGIDPIGKMMVVNNDPSRTYKVDGVIEDIRPDSHFQYDFFVTMSGLEFYPGEQTNWLASNYPTYIRVRPGTDPKELAKKFELMGEKYYLPRMIEAGFPDPKDDLKNLSYSLQPIDEIYLYSNDIPDGLNHGDIRFTWLAGAIAVFILIIACINFINLSTAKSANRAKEVGLRKVVGSVRGNLINQFLSESILYSFLSFILGLLLATLFLPLFNQLIGKNMAFPWTAWWLAPVLIGGAFIVGIFSGIYPSFYLSSFRPIEVLKGNIARGSKSARMRSALVVFQFTTSIILIIGTFIIYRQMQHILTTKIGFNKEQVLLIQGTNLIGDEKIRTFKSELLRVRDVQNATISDYLPIRGTKRNGNGFWNEGKRTTDKSIGAQFWIVDHDYIKTLGMKVIEGRDFSVTIPSDTNGIIINQAMVKELNLKDPIGKRIENYRAWNVIGVVEDFNFESLKQNVRPLAMILGISPSITSVKIKTTDMQATLSSISKVWKQFAPHQPMRYVFLDESYARMYEDVQRMGKIFTTFAILAIIVACLGLFGLSSFLVEQRSKEISIRLVLGASVNSIFRLLTQNFVKLVLVSFVIASPVAWYIMKKWLEDFVYRTDITADIFVLAGIIAVIIALFTISYQAIRAAMIKPVESLRSE